MAGDWIKMRIDLQSHPKIVRILSEHKTDKFRVIGGLHAVWSVFDTHSEDGVLNGYSPEALDHVIGWNGFSASLVAIGWLENIAGGLVMPEFCEHNGKSGKRRAEDQKRKRESRKDPQIVRNSSGNGQDEKLTREEKRREEIKDQEHCDQQAGSQGHAVKIPYDEILDAFKSKLPGFPQPRRPLDEDRRKAVRQLWMQREENGSVDFFSRYFGYIAKSDFLMGETGWTSCNFDWVFKPKNFRKIIEGTYHKEASDA